MLARRFVTDLAVQQHKHPHFCGPGKPDLRGALFIKAQTGHKRSSKMPKMKTKSSAKKRFKITASGKVKAAAAGKRHGMIKRTNKFIRDARGTMVLAEPDGRKVIKNYLPNGL
jgi:large subunit ribosomal protein L35